MLAIAKALRESQAGGKQCKCMLFCLICLGCMCCSCTHVVSAALHTAASKRDCIVYIVMYCLTTSDCITEPAVNKQIVLSLAVLVMWPPCLCMWSSLPCWAESFVGVCTCSTLLHPVRVCQALLGREHVKGVFLGFSLCQCALLTAHASMNFVFMGVSEGAQ